jgi:hypothetical protein
MARARRDKQDYCCTSRAANGNCLENPNGILIIQPKVVPQALPWVNVPQISINPEWVESIRRFWMKPRWGLNCFYPYPRVAPKAFGATLG